MMNQKILGYTMKENEKEYNPSECVHLRERVQVCKPQEVVLIVVHAQVS